VGGRKKGEGEGRKGDTRTCIFMGRASNGKEEKFENSATPERSAGILSAILAGKDCPEFLAKRTEKRGKKNKVVATKREEKKKNKG